MNKIYRDEIFKFNQFDLRKDKTDSQRFFLNYLPQEIDNKYNFNNLESLKKFRNDCLKWDSPLQEMGGCNLQPNIQKGDIQYSGIKISDPSGKIFGSFNISNGKIIYSPIFPRFYEERDNIKFAKDIYFTTMTFEEIMYKQIDLAQEFYVHTGNYMNIKKIVKNGDYIFEKINQDKMLEFINSPEKGEKIFMKHLGIK